jgi:hypothetical protein
MDLTITLSDTEVEALQLEMLTPDETLEQVVHRQISPIVGRLVSMKFTDLISYYTSQDIIAKSEIISDLEALRTARLKRG